MHDNNPYRPAVDGAYVPSAFAGRTAAYSHINQYLADPHSGQAAVFIGQAAIGKSALLWHFREFFAEGYVGVYIPLRRLQDALITEADLLETVASYITQALTDRRYPTASLPDTTRTAVNREWFEADFLAAIFASLRGRARLVLLLDDADVLLDLLAGGGLPADHIGFLSDLLAALPGLGMVMTLSDGAEERLAALAPLTDISQVARLENLSAEEIALLMRIPEEYTLTDEAAAFIWRATGGGPLLAQRVGYTLYERAINEPSTAALDVQEVRAVLPGVVEESTAQFRAMWAALTLDERLVLTAISDLTHRNPLHALSPADIGRWLVGTDYPLDPTTTRAAIRGLEYAHVVRHEQDGLVVAAGLVQMWLLQNARMEPRTGNGPQTMRRGLLIALIVVVLALLLTMAVGDGLFQRTGDNLPTPPPTVTLER